LILAVVIALVNIGTAQALGILVSMFNSALLASYGITIACILFHRLQGRRLPNSRFSLGKWGILANIVALVYITPLFLFSFFPATPNPTPNAMNWAIVMVGGVIVLATVYYIIWGRKTYTPPNETIEDFMERYEATTASSEKAEGSSAVGEVAESKQLD
jgi:amino acid transporter